mmetsp:Transcript_14038/g.53329  ORF Transcript_14038/g.53329 Transcript_14038/m.53329 type:complete len:247 (+) Transcript_14038:1236-1976(+)
MERPIIPRNPAYVYFSEAKPSSSSLSDSVSSGPRWRPAPRPDRSLRTRARSLCSRAAFASAAAAPEHGRHRTRSRQQYHRSRHPCRREYFPGHATPSTVNPQRQQASRTHPHPLPSESQHASTTLPASPPPAASLEGRSPVAVCTMSGGALGPPLLRSRGAQPQQRRHANGHPSTRHLVCCSGVDTRSSAMGAGQRSSTNTEQTRANGNVSGGRPTTLRPARHAAVATPAVAAASAAMNTDTSSRR